MICNLMYVNLQIIEAIKRYIYILVNKKIKQILNVFIFIDKVR